MAQISRLRGYGVQDTQARSAVLQQRLGRRVRKADSKAAENPVKAHADFIQRLLSSPFVYEVHVDDLHPTGLVLDGEPPGYVQVRHIDADAPDFMHGIEAGDYIVAVNGLALQHLSAWEVTLAMNQRPLWISLWRKRRGPPPSFVRDIKLDGTYNFYITEDAMLGCVVDGAPSCPLFVREVMPRTAASQQGVEVGDEIVSINGKDAVAIQPDDVAHLLRTRPLSLQLRPRRQLSSIVGGQDVPWPIGAYEVTFTSEDKAIGIIPGGWSPYQLRIDCVLKHSAADKLGVRVGDVLLQLNGQDILGLNRATIIAALCERPVTLLLQHGSVAQPAMQQGGAFSPEQPVGGLVESVTTAFAHNGQGPFSCNQQASVGQNPAQRLPQGEGSKPPSGVSWAHRQQSQHRAQLGVQAANTSNVANQFPGKPAQSSQLPQSPPAPSSTEPLSNELAGTSLASRLDGYGAAPPGGEQSHRLGVAGTGLRSTAPISTQVGAGATEASWPGLEGLPDKPPVLAWSWGGPGPMAPSVPVSLAPVSIPSGGRGKVVVQGCAARSDVRERADRVAKLFKDILD